MNFQAWSNYWFRISKNQRMELLTESIGWKTTFIGDKEVPTSKRAVINMIVWDAVEDKRTEVIEDIYNSIISLGYDNSLQYTQIEYIYWWLLTEMKEGPALDRYWILSNLEDYYRKSHFLDKAIEVCKISYCELPTYIPDMRNSYLMIAEGECLPSYTFSRDQLHFDLIDAHKFDESREMESDMIEKGYFEGNEGLKRLRQIQIMRSSYEADYLIKTEQIQEALVVISQLETLEPIYAAEHYKSIGNTYYKQKDYLHAKQYYELALNLNSSISGVQTKMNWVKNKLEKK